VKGFGLPLAGHKDNHSGLLSAQQIEALRREFDVAEGAEFEPHFLDTHPQAVYHLGALPGACCINRREHT